MIHRVKSKWLAVLAITGLFFTYACGHEGGDSQTYKAENVQNSNPASVTNTVGSPAEMSIGDIYTVTFDGTDYGSIDFTGTDASAEFILAVSSIGSDVIGSQIVQLSDEDVPLEAMTNEAVKDDSTGWEGWSAKEALDQQLRTSEFALSHEANIAVAAPKFNAAGAMKAMVASVSAPRVGDTKSFSVLGGISSMSSYKTVTGTVKCIGENVIFYVDNQVAQYNPQDLTDADVNKLCVEFDRIAGIEQLMFGQPSDVNDDGRIAVLMTPQVNRLGAMGGGIITGFFFANDLYSSSNSNQMEIIYVMVPDSGGTYGMKIPKQFAMDNLLPAVLPHELQHAISYNLKVISGGGSAEENWLNEGLSHLAEDLVGYGQENPSRVEVFLSDPAAYGVVTAGSPGLAERGAIYLFLRYMYEQSRDGRQFVHDLLNSNLTGVANVEAAFGGTEQDFDQFSEFILRWNAAIMMSSFNLSSDPKFSYATRVKNSDTGHWQGVCLSCDTEDGRGTILTGVSLSPYYGVSQLSLESTASGFYQMTSFPQRVTLAARSSGEYGAALARFK